MKLTKGKISKLLKNKKQTVRRNAEIKQSAYAKTFRSKKKLNLKNKSVKKWIGGEDQTIESNLIKNSLQNLSV